MTDVSNTCQELVRAIARWYHGPIIHGAACYTIPGEPDIWFPELKLAIIITPRYWYTTSMISKTVNELVEPMVRFNAMGIKLMMVSEALWQDYTDLVINRLRVKMGYAEVVYARKLQIREVDSTTASEFLNRHHLFGSSELGLRNVALFQDDKLCMLSSWGIRQQAPGYDWELLRMASTDNVIIAGGVSRMIKWFNANVGQPFSSLTDVSWGTTSGSWERFGMVHLYTSNPNMIYLSPKHEIELQNINRLKASHKNYSMTELVTQGFTPILDYGYHVMVSQQK